VIAVLAASAASAADRRYIYFFTKTSKKYNLADRQALSQ